MVVPVYRSFRNGAKSRVMYTVFKDGVIYYLCLFILTLANMVVVTTMSPDYFNIILMLERAVRSIITCRVVLHTRQEVQNDNTILIRSISGPHFHS
ncbi:hypothetical protein BDQ17DRAFT_1384404 [Cyathus striatus]|nr:hypothetical protein BDQ17DRAFT_1384404 [Cyathus striatus]